MEIIIGRENVPSPRLQLMIDGKIKFYGEPGSVPKTVSRKHCRLVMAAEGIRLENLSQSNVLYVNGKEFEAKSIKPTDIVELGPDRYRLDLETLVSVLSEDRTGKAVSGQKADVLKPEYSLAPLEKVWNDYDKAKFELQVRERKFNALSSGTGILTMGGMVCAFIPAFASVRLVLIVITMVILVVFFIIRMKNSNEVPLLQRELEKQFHKDYVCPNPKCRHFFGNQPYEDISKNVVCPWCKSKFRP